jgi:hypothetical protein
MGVLHRLTFHRVNPTSLALWVEQFSQARFPRFLDRLPTVCGSFGSVSRRAPQQATTYKLRFFSRRAPAHPRVLETLVAMIPAGALADLFA